MCHWPRKVYMVLCSRNRLQLGHMLEMMRHTVDMINTILIKLTKCCCLCRNFARISWNKIESTNQSRSDSAVNREYAAQRLPLSGDCNAWLTASGSVSIILADWLRLGC